MNTIKKMLLVCIGLSLITGCTPRLPVESPTWKSSGSLSVQTARNQNAIANFSWQQTGESYVIDIHSPLNFYTIRLEGSPGSAVLFESHHRPQTATSPEILLFNRLGWNVPVSYLTYWIRGLAVPGIHSVADHYDAAGHLTTQQTASGWRVRCYQYVHHFPQRLDITGPGLKMRIAIKNVAF